MSRLPELPSTFAALRTNAQTTTTRSLAFTP